MGMHFQVLGADESGSSSLVIASLTQRNVQMHAKAVQTDDAAKQPPKEFEYLGKGRQANISSSKLDARYCGGDHLSTQVEQGGQRTRGPPKNPPRKSSEPKSSLTEGEALLDKDIDLGSLPVSMFPPLSTRKINLVTMKANTTDADMFREYPSRQGYMVLQRACFLEMSLLLPDLSQ